MASPKKKKMLILSIAHNIYLTREERYALASKQSIEVISPSIPVWFYKGSTSEPATEVFCRYILTNVPGPASVAFANDGYLINIPQLPEDYEPPERVPDDEWRTMSREDQEKWYEDHTVPLNGNALRDPQDKGGAYMRFQLETNTIRKKRQIKLAHYVEIRDISELIESLIL